LNLGLAFGVAILSHFLVEQPCIAYGRRLTGRLGGGLKPADRLGVLQA
jgi:peptidoglycan/LPS O-acetylase OafA/YrhL